MISEQCKLRLDCITDLGFHCSWMLNNVVRNKERRCGLVFGAIQWIWLAVLMRLTHWQLITCASAHKALPLDFYDQERSRSACSSAQSDANSPFSPTSNIISITEAAEEVYLTTNCTRNHFERTPNSYPYLSTTPFCLAWPNHNLEWDDFSL